VAPPLKTFRIAAMLARSKGRDFYDLMFLLAQAKPDYDLQKFKQATAELLKTVDLKKSKRILNTYYSIKQIVRRFYVLGNL